jgi:hypothetical protein
MKENSILDILNLLVITEVLVNGVCFILKEGLVGFL